MSHIQFAPKNLICGLALLLFSTGIQALTLSIDNQFSSPSGFGSTFCFNVVPVGFGCSPHFITGHDGIIIGEAQPAVGSHPGQPDGTETPAIDEPWSFLGHTGMHLTTSPVTILSQTGNTMMLDFSGWAVTWNEFSIMELGTGAWNSGNQDGIAAVTCAVDCSDGDTYELSYSATVPIGHPTGFGGVEYLLNLHGSVTIVPVPAAVWLFGSGIILLLIGNNRGRHRHVH